MEGIFQELTTYGYIALFLYSLGGGFVALLAGAILSYMGKMDITIVIGLAFVANVIGDTVIFKLSRSNKKEVLNYFKKFKRELALSHLLLRKYGSSVIILQKYIQGVRTLIPVVIGISTYDFFKFTILNIIGAAIWALSIGMLGFLTGEYFVKFVYILADKPWIMLTFGLSFFLLFFLLFKFILRKK